MFSRQRGRRSLRRSRRRQQPQQPVSLTAGEATKQKEVARYNNIENWIVSKKILPHDDLCAKCIAIENPTQMDSASPLEDPSIHSLNRKRSTTETLDDDEDERDCAICFEKLQVGEIASWSPDPSCHHIFHHSCIKEWLLQHSGCPSCRATFLPVDRFPQQDMAKQSRRSLKQVKELLHAQQRRSRHCYYCVSHGAVYPPSRHVLKIQLSPKEMETMQARARQVPTKEELLECRGQIFGPGEDVNIRRDSVGGDEDELERSSDNAAQLRTMTAANSTTVAPDDDCHNINEEDNQRETTTDMSNRQALDADLESDRTLINNDDVMDSNRDGEPGEASHNTATSSVHTLEDIESSRPLELCSTFSF